MFQDLVLSEVAPICCVAFLWFSNYAFLFYGMLFFSFCHKKKHQIKPPTSVSILEWSDSDATAVAADSTLVPSTHQEEQQALPLRTGHHSVLRPGTDFSAAQHVPNPRVHSARPTRWEMYITHTAHAIFVKCLRFLIKQAHGNTCKFWTRCWGCGKWRCRIGTTALLLSTCVCWWSWLCCHNVSTPLCQGSRSPWWRWEETRLIHSVLTLKKSIL